MKQKQDYSVMAEDDYACDNQLQLWFDILLFAELGIGITWLAFIIFHYYKNVFKFKISTKEYLKS